MARQTAAARARENTPPPVPPASTPDEGALAKMDFWQRQALLTEKEKQNCRVHIYRLTPAITKDGDSNIEVVDSHLFDKEYLRTRYGGGKYQLYHNSLTGSDLEGHKYTFKRIVELPGQALIYPNHILVSEEGKPLPVSANQPTVVNVKNDDSPGNSMGAVVREVAQASRSGFDTATETLKGAIGLITTAATEAIKMKGPNTSETSGDVQALKEQVSRLESLIVSEREKRLATEIQSLRGELNDMKNKGTGNGGKGNALATAAQELGIEGGILGLAKVVSGNKEDSVLEHVGKRLGDALGSFIESSGPRLVDWLYQRDKMTNAQRPAVVNVTQSPAPNPASHPQPLPEETEDQSMPSLTETVRMLKEHVPLTIFKFWGRDFGGQETAEVVKETFKPWLPMMREQFNDLASLRKMAAEHNILKEMTTAEDWEEWSEKFFTEFHRVDPDEKPATVN